MHVFAVLDDVACAMVTDKGLDIAAGVEALKTAGLWNLFDEVGIYAASLCVYVHADVYSLPCTCTHLFANLCCRIVCSYEITHRVLQKCVLHITRLPS